MSGATKNFLLVRLATGKTELFPFDAKNIVFGNKEAAHAGRCVVTRRYHLVDEQRGINEIVDIQLQTPTLRSPFGLSIFTAEKAKQYGKGGNNRGDKPDKNPPMSISYEIGDYAQEHDEGVADFVTVIRSIDEATVAHLEANKDKFWVQGAQFPSDTLVVFGKYTLLTGKKPGTEYDKTLDAKFRRDRTGAPEARLFNGKLEQIAITEENMPPRTYYQSILHDEGIAFSPEGNGKSVFAVKQLRRVEFGVDPTPMFA